MEPAACDGTMSGFRAERVPLELWLQIIEYSDMTQQDIAKLTCISKFLAWVAQPLLFANFTVTQLQARNGGAFARCQRTAYRTRMQLRLNFIKQSERVAASVKSIAILVRPGDLYTHPEDLVGADDIIDDLLDVLPHLPNLKAFYACQVNFTQTRIDQLVNLPHLEALHFDTCSASGDFALRNRQLRHLSLHGEITGTKYGWWIPLVRSATLTHLSYDAHARARENPRDPREDLLPALAIGPVMSSLRVLRLPNASPLFPCFIPALSRCPSVEELLIETIIGEDLHLPTVLIQGPLPNNVFPHLKAVNAPWKFVERCLPGRPIKHITTSLPRSGGLEIPLAVIALHCPGLEEFTVNMVGVVFKRGLSSVLQSLPHLRGLHLEIDNPLGVRQYQDVFNSLEAIDYPPGLKSLHIHCPVGRSRHHALIDLPRKRDVTADHQQLVRHLRRKCPQLVEINISAFTYCVIWKDPYTKIANWSHWSDRGVRVPLS